MPMRINIYRYDPDYDDQPYTLDYDVDPATAGPMLLDALLFIKANLDSSLSLRRSCREGVCGSDGMNINGRNGRACITPLSALAGSDECIQCGGCSSACPSFWWNPDKFVGPAGLLAAYRFIADSRDEAGVSRLEDLQDAYRLFRCRGIINCMAVCPRGLNPTAAIGAMKVWMLTRGRSG